MSDAQRSRGPWIAALVVLLVAATGAWLVRRDATPAPAPATPPAAAPSTPAAAAPKLLQPGLVAARRVQTELLGEAERLTLSEGLVPPPAHSAGAAAVAAELRNEAESAAPEAAQAEQIAILFSGGEIGETDPCG
ncbi:MAG: hypothetical protein RIT45_3767 [Pseudomonadota bacterium]|jgi:hypothetical protein